MPCLACSRSERGHTAQGIAGVGALLVVAFTRYGGANLRGNLEDLAAPVIGFVGSCYDWAREKVSGEYPMRGWSCGEWAHGAAAVGAGLERQYVVPAPACLSEVLGFSRRGFSRRGAELREVGGCGCYGWLKNRGSGTEPPSC